MIETREKKIIEISFSELDVQAIAEESGIDLELAIDRAQSWAAAISDRAVELINEQLSNAIVGNFP